MLDFLKRFGSSFLSRKFLLCLLGCAGAFGVALQGGGHLDVDTVLKCLAPLGAWVAQEGFADALERQAAAAAEGTAKVISTTPSGRTIVELAPASGPKA